MGNRERMPAGLHSVQRATLACGLSVMLALAVGCGGEAPKPPAAPAPAPAARAAAPKTDWSAAARAGILAGEYRINAGAGKAMTAFNRGGGLRVTWDGGAAAVLSTTQTQPDALSLRTTGVGRAGAERGFGGGDFALGACRADGARDERGECLRRIERSAGKVTEYWENRPGGVEQGFVLAEAPRGKGKLRIQVEVKGAKVTLDPSGSRATLLARGGQRYRYDHLIAWDADKKPLPARMVAGAGGIALEVDDAGAKYPVVVDPVLSTPPAVVFESNEANGGNEVVVGSAGDVNGDGYDDVFVAYPHFDGGITDQGRVFVYHGGPNGPDTTADWSSSGSGTASSLYGRAAASAGDVNNDGFGDLIVGQPNYANPDVSEGRIYVYHGSAMGLSLTANFTQESDLGGAAFFGRSVASAGDINGDGFDDVVVGMSGYDVGAGTNEGRVLVYKGSMAGLAATPSDTITGAAAGYTLGFNVSGAGDVNGDGRDDILISALNANNGFSYIHLGNADGTITDTAAWTYVGGAASGLGPVSAAGDVNGDGIADIVVGAYQTNASTGEVYVFYGASPGGPSTTPSVSITSTVGGRLGRSVAGGGDINGDGYADIIVSAPFYGGGAGTSSGAVYVFLGGPTGPASTVALADHTLLGDQALARFGGSVANAGDVNGDGYADVIVGSDLYANGQTDEGAGSLFLGGPDQGGVASTTDWAVDPDLANARGGAALASADFNGDGFADVASSATGPGTVSIYSGAAGGPSTTATAALTVAGVGFGTSLAGGDVNGDGYDDLVVGAPQYANGEATEGRIYIYLGSAAGITGATVPVTFEPNVAGALLGTSVGAGDLNADGRFEVIAGAPGFAGGQAGEGRVYVFLGAAIGPNVTTPQTFESDSINAALGTAVASAGDVNGDGYGDVVAGAPGWSGAGRVYAILGGLTGLTAVARTADGTAGSGLGHSVASVGDVTGDGFADIAAGSPTYANGEAAEGRVSVFPGGAGAFGTTYNYEPNLVNAALGTSVAGGDLNGDGLGDLVAGAPGAATGTTHVFLAVAGGGGLPVAPSGSVVQGSGFIHTGAAVATGDVNGDSATDLISGAPDQATGQALEGRTSIFFGNRGGRPFRLRAQNPAGTPNAMRGAVVAGSMTSFRVAMEASSFVGRSGIKLEVEARPVGVAFTGTGTIDAAFTDTAGNASVALQQTLSGLVMATPYHFRARLLFNPTEQRIQRKTPWYYGGVLGNSTQAGVRLDGVTTGTTCTMNSDCGSGFCVDGVCCNNACAGGTTDCQACSIAAGAAVNGTCGPRTAGLTCSDGNMCTTADTCDSGGTCTAGTPVSCTASDQCHDVGVCDTTTGSCSNPVKANGTTCSDANACTTGDTCQIGVCTPASTATCAAPDQCHTAGTCDTSSGTCVYPAKADGTACNDANACTATDTCMAGVCTGTGGVTCAASDSCHDVGVCDTTTGTCSNPAKANGTTCSDGTMCTSNDVCSNGVCAGTTVTCNDNNACTSDSCVAAVGCVNAPVPACNLDGGTPDADAGPDVSPEAGPDVVEPRPDGDAVVEPKPDASDAKVDATGGTSGSAGSGGTGAHLDATLDTPAGDAKSDAKTDAPVAVAGGGGCDCDVGKKDSGAPLQAVVFIGLGLMWLRRRRRS
jgi:MYXO-CTERM domain-containing protein